MRDEKSSRIKHLIILVILILVILILVILILVVLINIPDIIARVLLEVFDEVGLGTPTFVDNWIALVISLEENKRREATHIDSWNINLIGGGVHLRNDHILLISEYFANLVVCRGELLAVSAPWCVELHQHVLRVIHNNLLKGFASTHSHRALSVARVGFLALQCRLEGSLQSGTHERLHCIYVMRSW